MAIPMATAQKLPVIGENEPKNDYRKCGSAEVGQSISGSVLPFSSTNQNGNPDYTASMARQTDRQTYQTSFHIYFPIELRQKIVAIVGSRGFSPFLVRLAEAELARLEGPAVVDPDELRASIEARQASLAADAVRLEQAEAQRKLEAREAARLQQLEAGVQARRDGLKAKAEALASRVREVEAAYRSFDPKLFNEAEQRAKKALFDEFKQDWHNYPLLFRNKKLDFLHELMPEAPGGCAGMAEIMAEFMPSRAKKAQLEAVRA